MQKLLDDDDDMEEVKEVNQAKAEDDVSEGDSEKEEDGKTQGDCVEVEGQSGDKILIVDSEEASAIRVQSAKVRKRKHRKVERYDVDPKWLEKIKSKRFKTGERDGDEEKIESAIVGEKAEIFPEKLDAIANTENYEIKRGLLIDYLEHLKSL